MPKLETVNNTRNMMTFSIIRSNNFNWRQYVIYMHISSENQRNEAEGLMRQLRDLGTTIYKVTNLVAEGIVTSDNKNPDTGETVFETNDVLIKFYYEADRDEAECVKSIIAKDRNDVSLASHKNYPSKPEEGVLEIWYPWLDN